jgi:sugar lactone lactonase YvrE
MLSLESLEERAVPASLSVGDVAVREGAASLGVLDPAGATALNLNRPRNIVFNDIPGSAHYHDLFVPSNESGLGGQVLRFDWASQTYQAFVPYGSGGLQGTGGITFGPDGNLYVSSPGQSAVFEFDGETGNFISVYVPTAMGGLSTPYGIKFASDGNLYVASSDSNQILKYEGPTSPDGLQAGQFLGVFANTVHTKPFFFDFGPDGNVYVSCPQGGISSPTAANSFIDRYYGPANHLAGQFMDTFVANGTGGLSNSRSLLFDQQGNLLVADADGHLNEVLKFQGPNGSNPGAYIEAYVTSGQGNLDAPNGLAVGPDGNLYVGSKLTSQVLRFAPSSQASFVVTLSAASASQVSVNFATVNGTAVSGTDYTQTSGTLVFAPGVTSQTVTVPITSVATGGPTKTFTLSLSGPSGASLGRGQATGSILNRVTKFFVADSGSNAATFQYGSGGTSEEISPQASGNTAPRGLATTAVGDKVWVVDANKTVYVYSNHGTLLGSWSPSGLNVNAQLEGVATNGTDVWLLDNGQDKIYKYTGAASRLSGSQSAVSSFNLASGKNGNANGKGLVTDRSSIWVVDDGTSTDKVFKYSLAGSSLGNWTIDTANSHPTGLTINPASVSDIWIVDNVTLKVYQYANAATRISGSQNAAATFALAAGNTNPQDIADPPAPDLAISVSDDSIMPIHPAVVQSLPSTLATTPEQTPSLNLECVGWLAQTQPGAPTLGGSLSLAVTQTPVLSLTPVTPVAVPSTKVTPETGLRPTGTSIPHHQIVDLVFSDPSLGSIDFELLSRA